MLRCKSDTCIASMHAKPVGSCACACWVSDSSGRGSSAAQPSLPHESKSKRGLRKERRGRLASPLRSRLTPILGPRLWRPRRSRDGLASTCLVSAALSLAFVFVSAVQSYDGPLANRSGMLGKKNTGGVMSQQARLSSSPQRVAEAGHSAGCRIIAQGVL